METLKKRIENRGIKQAWIARKLGIHRSTLNNFLTGTRNMPQEISDEIKKLIK